MSILDRFSVVTFPWGPHSPTLEGMIEVTRHAEELGFYSINIPLLNHAPNHGPFAPFDSNYSLDALVVLPALVQATSKIRIAVDAVPMVLLHPYQWAKYFASLDVISGGRTIVGMCLGLSQPTFDTVGVDRKYRGRIADEQVEMITKLWTGDSVTHEGRFYSVRNARLEPKPVQKPHPPIWWAGMLPSVPRATRWAEYLNPAWLSPREVAEQYVPRLEEENGKRGTSTKLSCWLYTRITPDRELSGDEIDEWFVDMMDLVTDTPPRYASIAGSPDQCAAMIKEYFDAGLDHIVLDFERHSLDNYEATMEGMDLLVEKVLPLLGD